MKFGTVCILAILGSAVQVFASPFEGRVMKGQGQGPTSCESLGFDIGYKWDYNVLTGLDSGESVTLAVDVHSGDFYNVHTGCSSDQLSQVECTFTDKTHTSASGDTIIQFDVACTNSMNMLILKAGSKNDDGYQFYESFDCDGLCANGLKTPPNKNGQSLAISHVEICFDGCDIAPTVVASLPTSTIDSDPTESSPETVSSGTTPDNSNQKKENQPNGLISCSTIGGSTGYKWDFNVLEDLAPGDSIVLGVQTDSENFHNDNDVCDDSMYSDVKCEFTNKSYDDVVMFDVECTNSFSAVILKAGSNEGGYTIFDSNPPLSCDDDTGYKCGTGLKTGTNKNGVGLAVSHVEICFQGCQSTLPSLAEDPNQPILVASTPPPTESPSVAPVSSAPTPFPSGSPTLSPTPAPSNTLTDPPTLPPTKEPTNAPTKSPTEAPTPEPTSRPSPAPSSTPTPGPTEGPTISPSASPSFTPTESPSAIPSVTPSEAPSSSPSSKPSVYPSVVPSVTPSASPSGIPSSQPSVSPSGLPSTFPSGSPSELPSGAPSSIPSARPSSSPSVSPSSSPSGSPSAMPSGSPSASPSTSPSTSPSVAPSASPSTFPSASPSGAPTSSPSASPSAFPSVHPSASPSATPTSSPSALPSEYPTLSPQTTCADVDGVVGFKWDENVLTTVANSGGYACFGFDGLNSGVFTNIPGSTCDLSELFVGTECCIKMDDGFESKNYGPFTMTCDIPFVGVIVKDQQYLFTAAGSPDKTVNLVTSEKSVGGTPYLELSHLEVCFAAPDCPSRRLRGMRA